MALLNGGVRARRTGPGAACDLAGRFKLGSAYDLRKNHYTVSWAFSGMLASGASIAAIAISIGAFEGRQSKPLPT